MVIDQITIIKAIAIVDTIILLVCIRAYIECRIVMNYYKFKVGSLISKKPKVTRWQKFMDTILFMPKF